ncbi:MAG: glucose-1-phosphate thymidylyltransferase [Candidatus Eisenbacteria bacterium]|nr:glucose-1-phosphate thymidylyltransferase [Candidatus Eisenbacteria bacterium]
MKALVLAGGKGTRLRPITHTSAKQLVPIANKPILFYGLESIRDAGIVDTGIIVGDTYREIEDAVGDGESFGLRVTYIRQEAPLGLAHAVLTARDYIGSEPFVMYLGDNLIMGGITDFVSEFRKNRPNAQILLARVENPSDFGVAELSGGSVVRLEEKPEKPGSDLALVGVYMFDGKVFSAAESISPSWRNELEITDAIQWLIDSGADVRAHEVTGWWKDTGKLEDILEANRMLLGSVERGIHGTVDGASRVDGNVVVEEGASIEDSVLRGPLVIGRDSRIEKSYIGPFTSIYHDVTVHNSEIEHSIVLENSTIADLGQRMERSLVGKDVEIRKCATMPKAYRFMVGDASRIEVP